MMTLLLQKKISEGILPRQKCPTPRCLYVPAGKRELVTFCFGKFHILSYILPMFYGLILEKMITTKLFSITRHAKEGLERLVNRQKNSFLCSNFCFPFVIIVKSRKKQGC